MKVTKADIQKALQRVGVAGCPVCVHASLSSFGYVDGGAKTVVDAFVDSGSTLVVPTFSWSYSVARPLDTRLLSNGQGNLSSNVQSACSSDVYTTASKRVDKDMGAVPAEVVASAGRVRGDHPMNSFSAIGGLANEFIRGQAPLDVYAPLDELARRGGYVILMGVGLNRMTLLHLAEKRAGRNLFRRWANDKNGSPFAVEVGGCSEGFDNLRVALEPLMTVETVGYSVWRVFRASDVLHKASEAIRLNPQVTQCASPGCERCRDAIAGGPVLD